MALENKNKQSFCQGSKEFCQENTLVIANTIFQQHKRRLYPWTSPDGQYQNQIDYVLCSLRWGSSIQSAKTRLGADCDSDHEIFIAKFRLKLNKVEKATTQLQYSCLENPQGWESLEGCCQRGHLESDTTEATLQQQQPGVS